MTRNKNLSIENYIETISFMIKKKNEKIILLKNNKFSYCSIFNFFFKKIMLI